MERTQEFAQLLDTLTQADLQKLCTIMEQMHKKTVRQKKAIMQAMKHATYEQLVHGAETMSEAITKYNDHPWTLAGLAYAAGVAEGKQKERNRRQFAKIKQDLRDQA